MRLLRPPREPEEFDPTQPLVATGNLRRRHLVSRFAQALAIAAAVAAVAVLVIVIIAVVSHGVKAISWDFITESEPEGIGPFLVGTGIVVGVATLIAMPIGVLISLFLSEYAGNRLARPVQTLMDVMNGLPSIIIALFVVSARRQQADRVRPAVDRPRDHRGAADRPRHPGGPAASCRAPSAKPPTRSASPAGAAS